MADLGGESDDEGIYRRRGAACDDTGIIAAMRHSNGWKLLQGMQQRKSLWQFLHSAREDVPSAYWLRLQRLVEPFKRRSALDDFSLRVV